jgi:hypothetical protein
VLKKTATPPKMTDTPLEPPRTALETTVKPPDTEEIPPLETEDRTPPAGSTAPSGQALRAHVEKDLVDLI